MSAPRAAMPHWLAAASSLPLLLPLPACPRRSHPPAGPRRQAAVKPKFRAALVELITEAGAAGGCPKPQGALLYTTASKVHGGQAQGRETVEQASGRGNGLQHAGAAAPRGSRAGPPCGHPTCVPPHPAPAPAPAPCARPQYPANALVHRKELLAYIMDERIRSNAQLDGGLEYLGKASWDGMDRWMLVDASLTPARLPARLPKCPCRCCRWCRAGGQRAD